MTPMSAQAQEREDGVSKAPHEKRPRYVALAGVLVGYALVLLAAWRRFPGSRWAVVLWTSVGYAMIFETGFGLLWLRRKRRTGKGTRPIGPVGIACLALLGVAAVAGTPLLDRDGAWVAYVLITLALGTVAGTRDSGALTLAATACELVCAMSIIVTAFRTQGPWWHVWMFAVVTRVNGRCMFTLENVLARHRLTPAICATFHCAGSTLAFSIFGLGAILFLMPHATTVPTTVAGAFLFSTTALLFFQRARHVQRKAVVYAGEVSLLLTVAWMHASLRELLAPVMFARLWPVLVLAAAAGALAFAVHLKKKRSDLFAAPTYHAAAALGLYAIACALV